MEKALRIFSEGYSITIASLTSLENPELTEVQRSGITMRLFDDALKTFIDGLQCHRSAKAHHHNTLLPISLLPNELLIRIFALASVEKDHFFTYRIKRMRFPLAELALVCREWRKILHGTPSLWAHICSDYPRQIYLECLARSDDVPLHVSLNEHTPHETMTFWEEICYKVHRWQSVEMVVKSMERLWELDRLKAPLLEKLHVRYDPLVGGLATINYFCESASRLRYVTLANVGIPWVPSLLCHLKTLNISHEIAVGLSAQQVVHVLHSCPDLVSVKLHLSSNSDPGPIPQDPFTMDLPQLKHLSLMVHPLITQHLLQWMRIPMCKSFDVDHDKPTRPTFSTVTEHLIPCLSSILHTTSQLTIRLAAYTLYYEATVATDDVDDRSVLRICFNSSGDKKVGKHYGLETLSWLLDNVHTPSFSSSTFLTISIISPHVAITSIIDRLSSVVTKLRLDTLGPPSEAILSYLSEPVEVAMGGTTMLTWLLPNLTELFAEGCPFLQPEVVLACVQRCAGHGSSQRGHEHRERRPARVSTLCLPRGTSTEELVRMFLDCSEWCGLDLNSRGEDNYRADYGSIYVSDDDHDMYFPAVGPGEDSDSDIEYEEDDEDEDEDEVGYQDGGMGTDE
ncbi:hypothetical protein FRB95_004967 [Tulasnella sp. JGI-2019a]|nr:hypothetical protein FRB95_004967 [Tulasnella sp. JGI-2019a]